MDPEDVMRAAEELEREGKRTAAGKLYAKLLDTPLRGTAALRLGQLFRGSGNLERAKEYLDLAASDPSTRSDARSEMEQIAAASAAKPRKAEAGSEDPPAEGSWKRRYKASWLGTVAAVSGGGAPLPGMMGGGTVMNIRLRRQADGELVTVTLTGAEPRGVPPQEGDVVEIDAATMREVGPDAFTARRLYGRKTGEYAVVTNLFKHF